jgi:predicted amidophosphoribosyltransferase
MDLRVSRSITSQIHRVFGVLSKHALDFIYPCHCRTCMRLAQDRDGLCPECWGAVHFIERPYCDILGTPFAVDHGEGTLSALAMAEPPNFDQLRSVVIHEGVAKRLAQQLKYHDRTDLAPLMAQWMVRASDGMLDDCDYIMAVPLHRWRLLSRCFNQSAELARQIGSVADRPFVPAALTRRKATRQQVGLTALGRKENMRGAFRITPGYEHYVAGKRI